MSDPLLLREAAKKNLPNGQALPPLSSLIVRPLVEEFLRLPLGGRVGPKEITVLNQYFPLQSSVEIKLGGVESFSQ